MPVCLCVAACVETRERRGGTPCKRDAGAEAVCVCVEREREREREAAPRRAGEECLGQALRPRGPWRPQGSGAQAAPCLEA